MAMQQEDKSTGFKIVQLFKDQILGIGSYGKVCRAKCDDLVCAAKLMHETLFDPTAQQLIAPHREHRLPMRRFEQECEFLSTIKHPNIIQYLGIYQDSATGLPVLLMELMDASLTHFLETSSQPIPYHIQVNVCHDIALALSFLHSNGIIHRDLSSNNVLLIGNVRAKVTDFGMARLGDQNPRATQLTFTMCPGTDVYMPPEAVQDKPVYTQKIDCFSFGVITLQILSRQFPEPGDRRKKIQISQPGLPPVVEVPVSEIERRQNHISNIDPNHTLLQAALDCLKDKDDERPSAQQLCKRLVALKEGSRYNESMGAVEARNSTEQRSDERYKYTEQLQDLKQIIQSQAISLKEKDQIIVSKDQMIAQKNEALGEKDKTIEAGQQQLRQLEREKNEAVEEKDRELRQKVGEISQLEKEKIQITEEKVRLERQLGRVNQQLEESERVSAQIHGKVPAMRLAADAKSKSKEQSSRSGYMKLIWREGGKAPCKMCSSYCAVADDSTLYVRRRNHEVYAYTISTSSWSQLPNSPTYNCPLVIINNLLTLVGGVKILKVHKSDVTNQLFSLTGKGNERRWTEEFPRLPTKRLGSVALCIGTALIVAGGKDKGLSMIQTVEVLDIETLRWSTTTDLPQPLSHAPVAVCGDRVYFVGESAMHGCSVSSLIQPRASFLTSFRDKVLGVWKEAAAPPVKNTACVTIHGQMLAIGGKDSDENPTTYVHMYNPTTNSWQLINDMATPRSDCIAAVLKNNQLMVVGGYTNKRDHTETDSIELATVSLI